VGKAEAKVFAKREHYKKLLNHATSPKSLAQVIHAFRKLSGHTVCMFLITFYEDDILSFSRKISNL
jgi:dihydroxyacetone kinase